MNPADLPVLWLAGCAAPPVLGIREIATAAVDAGWRVCLLLSPTAVQWLGTVRGELAALARLTGGAVHSEFWLPGQGRPFPSADAMLIAPATASTVNKCAAGISDTLVLGMANDAVGRGLPVVLVPATGDDGRHPAYRRSLRLLRSAGVEVIAPAAALPWREGLAAAGRRCGLPVPDHPPGALAATS